MAHPTGLAYGFAVVMASVSVYCIGRLAMANSMGRRNHHDINISHVLMGLAMVGMLVPRWSKVPNGLWEVAFGVIALYFLARSIRFVVRHGVGGTSDDHVHHLSHYLIHMVMACAMLYMYWLGMPITASSAPGVSMSGPPAGAGGDPGLTLWIIAVLLGSAVWQLDSISRFAPQRRLVPATAGQGGGGPGTEGPGDQRPWLAPRLEVACHIAMCLTMGYMLVLMV